MCEGLVLPILGLVKLCKDEIPYLQIPVAVAAHGTGRLAAAAIFAQVDINLRVRTAGTGADLPEIILELHDMVGQETGLLLPDFCRLVVLRIDCRVELFLRELHNLRQELPSPGDGLLLEVIAEREIAEHLKIRLMTGRPADVLDIARADAALARRDARTRRLHLAGEKRLERRHAGADHQQRRIVLGNQRSARKAQMTRFLFKKIEIRLAQLVARHEFHFHQLPLQTFSNSMII